MSVTLYDKALMQKINNWTSKSKLKVFGPQDSRGAMEVLADIEHDNNIELPFIILSRPDGYRIGTPGNTPISAVGKSIGYTDGNSHRVLLYRAIPIIIEYNLDVYTRYEEEADAYMREFIFNFINSPTLEVIPPYLDTGMSHRSNVRLANDMITKNPDTVAIHLDLIFSYRVQLDIDDAYLWDVRTSDAFSIGVDNSELLYQNPDGSYTSETL